MRTQGLAVQVSCFYLPSIRVAYIAAQHGLQATPLRSRCSLRGAPEAYRWAASHKFMQQTKSINEILGLADCDQLCLAYGKYLFEKKRSGDSLNESEEVVYLLLMMLPDIEMEGFADLFYQLYSLRECAIVEASLRTLNLNHLADLFAEAKLIYIRGQVDLTQEEYDQLEPFTLEDNQGHRFDEIDEMVLAKDSEIYLMGERLCQYIRLHEAQLGRSR